MAYNDMPIVFFNIYLLSTMKFINLLPEYTISQLTDCVVMKLQHFDSVNLETLWEGIEEKCQIVESEPRSVNTIILEARKENDRVFVNPQILKYHSKLTLLYIILYYRHPNDTIYKTVVFPQLIKNMGIYGQSENNLKKINSYIDNIIKNDKLVEDIKNNNVAEPFIAFKSIGRAELRKLLNDYCDERLFKEMYKIIECLDEKYNTNLDVSEIWYNAKQVIYTMQKVKLPEMYIKYIATDLVSGQISNGYKGSQIILLCIYAMVRSKENAHFKNFIIEMESINTSNSDMDVIYNNIGNIKIFLDEKQPFDDYNYFEDQIGEHELFRRADVNKMIKRIDSEYKDKIKQIENEKDKVINDQIKQIDELKNQVLNFEKDEAEGHGLNSYNAAILITTICHYNGGLPQNGRLTLYPLLQKIWGFSESTSKHALRNKIQQEKANELSNIFTDISPKISNYIKQLPDQLDILNKQRLVEMNEVTTQHPHGYE